MDNLGIILHTDWALKATAFIADRLYYMHLLSLAHCHNKEVPAIKYMLWTLAHEAWSEAAALMTQTPITAHACISITTLNV